MFGDRLRELREDTNMTQEDLAMLLNVSRQSISGYESELTEPNLENIVRLADIFNVSIDYLLGRTKEKVNLNLFSNDKKKLILEIIKSLEKFNVSALQNNSRKKRDR